MHPFMMEPRTEKIKIMDECSREIYKRENLVFGKIKII